MGASKKATLTLLYLFLTLLFVYFYFDNLGLLCVVTLENSDGICYG